MTGATTRPETTPAEPRGVADGQPITGPAYPSWQAPHVYPSGTVFTLPFVANRLDIAVQLYAAAMTPTMLDTTPGRLIDRALEHADKLIQRSATPAAPTSTDTPTKHPEPVLTVNAVKLLAVLAMDADAPFLPTDNVVGLEKGQLAAARREILKAGYAAFSTPEGSILLTQAGRDLLFV